MDFSKTIKVCTDYLEESNLLYFSMNLPLTFCSLSYLQHLLKQQQTN